MPPSRTDLESTSATSNSLSASQDAQLPKTRSTIRATPSQLSELNKVFQNTTRPTKGVRESLAERTGLCPDWISSWFMRQRKKAKSVRYKPEPSQSETIGHMLGIPGLSELSGPRRPSITPETSSVATTAPGSTNFNPGDSWPYHYSSSSAPALTPSVSTAHAVISLPGLNRNYIQIQTTINNQPFWHAFPPSHASTVTSQSTVSTPSSSSLRNPDNSSHRPYQFAPYVSQNSHYHQSIPSNVLFVKEVPRHPQSFYASADLSGHAAADKPGRSALPEPILDSRLDNGLLSNTTSREYSMSYTSHVGGLSTGVSYEKCIPSANRRNREDGVDKNVAQGGTSPFELTFPARKLPVEGVVLKTEFESFTAETGTDSVSGSGTVILTPASETETAISPICQGETESSPRSDTETTLEPMSEEAAWKKARAHPDFETFLKMAGVYGNFELTDNGLVLKK